MKKKFKSFRWPVYSAAVIVALTAGLGACNKQDKQAGDLFSEEKVVLKGSELLTKTEAPATDEGFKMIVASLKALTAAEASDFFRLKTEKELQSIPESEALLREQTLVIGKFRQAMNDLAVETYGKPVTAVSNLEIELLGKEVMRNGDYGILGANLTGAQEKAAGVLATCNIYSWPTYAPNTEFSGGRGYYGEYRSDNEPPAWNDPCDYEYRFSGTYNQIDGDFANDDLAIGSSVSRRYIGSSQGTHTCVLISAGLKALWKGAFPVYCRMRWY